MAVAAAACLRAFNKMAYTPLGSTDSLINQDEDVQSDQSHCKNAVNIVLMSGFIVVGGVALAILLLVRPSTETNPEYGVVFDAGSSHTSAYVYQWPGNERLRGTAVPLYEIYNGEQEPGISSFVSNPDGAGPSLDDLIRNVTRKVPQDKISSTPVYLGATAGMRLVQKVNKTASIDIMSSVNKTLLKSGFLFTNKSVKIISGEDEGAFGWITVNYLKKVLQEKHQANIKQSFGALDLGGASTQIAFVPQNISQATRHFKLYGKDYPVYTKTYLCYGLTEIYRRYLAQLAKNANYSAKIQNPCARKGTEFNKTASFMWCEPCSCEPSPKPSTTQFTFSGSSNFSQCSENILKLFDFRDTCRHPVSFSNDSQPPVTGSFLAFSGYYYIAANLNLSTTPTMAEFQSAYMKYCSKIKTGESNFHILTKKVPTCFAGHYIYTLLTHGYKFRNDTWNISFKKTVDKKSVGWALGYMINATNIIPLNEAKHVRIKDAILIPAIVVCAICILIGLILCVKFSRKLGVCKSPSVPGYTKI